MPTYEYACEACGHKFEEFQSIKAKPTTKCPECGKKKVKRLISAGAGFIFKGSGFYITDYRSDKYKSDAKGDTAGGTKTESGKSDSGKSESGKAETTKSEPTKSETSKAEPAKTSAKTETKAPSKPASPAKK